MTHTVVKAFHATEAGRVVQPGEPITPADESRAGELERASLIARVKVRPKPSNKDAAPQRKTK